MYWTCNSMNNLLSYSGLVDAKIRASDKDLPVRIYDFLPYFIPLLFDKVKFVDCLDWDQTTYRQNTNSTVYVITLCSP